MLTCGAPAETDTSSVTPPTCSSKIDDDGFGDRGLDALADDGLKPASSARSSYRATGKQREHVPAIRAGHRGRAQPRLEIPGGDRHARQHGVAGVVTRPVMVLVVWAEAAPANVPMQSSAAARDWALRRK